MKKHTISHEFEKSKAIIVFEDKNYYEYWFRIDDGYIMMIEEKSHIGKSCNINFCEDIGIIIEHTLRYSDRKIIVDNRVIGRDK